MVANNVFNLLVDKIPAVEIYKNEAFYNHLIIASIDNNKKVNIFSYQDYLINPVVVELINICLHVKCEFDVHYMR